VASNLYAGDACTLGVARFRISSTIRTIGGFDVATNCLNRSLLVRSSRDDLPLTGMGQDGIGRCAPYDALDVRRLAAGEASSRLSYLVRLAQDCDDGLPLAEIGECW